VNDTITALATPPGVSGLAVIRVSGPEAISVTDRCFTGRKPLSQENTHTIHFGNFHKGDVFLDRVTVSLFRTPHSYTGEDVIEIGCHGGNLVYREIIDTLIECGCRIAEPGEFTRRAFLNGKLDLTQVEAVADIIHSQSVPGVLTAARQLKGNFTERMKKLRKKLIELAGLLELELDFAEEDITFARKDEIVSLLDDTMTFCKDLADSYDASEILRSGYYIGIAGYPNSGKSTLFNTLLQRKRAITSHIPGTTRDYLEETLYIDGIAVRLVDTAGIRDTDDCIELEGIKMVASVLDHSNMILVINDMNISPGNSDRLTDSLRKKYPEKKIILIQNKIDLVEGTIPDGKEGIIKISARKVTGIDILKSVIGSEAAKSSERISDILVNQRHAVLLQRSFNELQSAKEAVSKGMENEFIALDIRRAIATIGEITGETWNAEILNNIFSRFCIGK